MILLIWAITHQDEEWRPDNAHVLCGTLTGAKDASYMPHILYDADRIILHSMTPTVHSI